MYPRASNWWAGGNSLGAVRVRRLSGVVLCGALVLATAGSRGPGRDAVPEEGPPGTVTVYGRAGAFGSLGATVPSGQTASTRAVHGWGFPPGVMAGRVVGAGDGTLVVAGVTQSWEGRSTSAQTVLTAFDPVARRSTTVRVPTTTGETSVRTPSGALAGGSVRGLVALGGRDDAVVFTVRRSVADRGPAAESTWPVLGVLTRDGPQWTVRRENVRSAAGIDALDPGTCADGSCAAFGDLASLPASGRLVAAVSDPPGLRVMRFERQPGAGGYVVRMGARYPFPRMEGLRVTPREVHADPTGIEGDERFVVGLDVTGSDGTPRAPVLQGFTLAGEGIRPTTPPLIPGTRSDKKELPFVGYGALRYDRDGNLWAARHSNLNGGSLALYFPGGNLAACRPDGRPVGDYRTRAADGAQTWGVACRPDFDLLQANRLVGMTGLIPDPDTGDMVALTLTGTLMSVRVSGRGAAMTFRMGTPVDLGRVLLPQPTPLTGDNWPGVVAAGHTLWIAAYQGDGSRDEVTGDQYLYAVRLADLFDPPPVPLSGLPGQETVVQLERTRTGTTQLRKGAEATVDVDPDAYFGHCAPWPADTGCGYDGVPGNDFILIDDSGYGHQGGPVEIPVDVAVAGRYRVVYRVWTFEKVTAAAVRLDVAGSTVVTPVSTNGLWRIVAVPGTVDLPAGPQVLRLSAPSHERSGWGMSWLGLQRA